jgi:hypothetical protein
MQILGELSIVFTMEITHWQGFIDGQTRTVFVVISSRSIPNVGEINCRRLLCIPLRFNLEISDGQVKAGDWYPGCRLYVRDSISNIVLVDRCYGVLQTPIQFAGSFKQVHWYSRVSSTPRVEDAQFDLAGGDIAERLDDLRKYISLQ